MYTHKSLESLALSESEKMAGAERVNLLGKNGGLNDNEEKIEW